MFYKIRKIRELQEEIEILESEIPACSCQEERDRINHYIGDLNSKIDCLREACE